MPTYKNINELKDNIRHLQVSREVQEKHLKLLFDELIESFKPKHILQSTYKGFTGSSKMIEIVIGSVLVVSGGFFIKKLIAKGTSRIFRSILNITAQSAITYAAAKYTGNFKSLLKHLLDRVTGKTKYNTAST